MPVSTNNGSSTPPAASAAPSVAPQTEVNELNQRELLDKVSLDFLDGPPPVQKPEAQKAVKPEKAEAPAATVEEPEIPQEPQETPVEDEDPGEEAPAQAFESDAQVPEWLKGALNKLPEGHWSRDRIPKLIEKALEKTKALAEKEARVVELEEKLAEVRATETASAESDIRGSFRNIEDPAQIQANLKAAEAWHKWAVNVKPDEFGSIPNPETKGGEDWTLADVHRRIQESDAIRQAAKAQLDYLNDYGKTHGEVKKQLPALFDLKSEERKLAQTFMDKLPWLDSRGDKEAILARLVLGEQVLQKRAKGVQTVDVSATSTAPKAAAPATKSAPVVSSAPLRAAGNAPDLSELRNRIQQGDHAAREEMAALFLS